MTLKHYKTIFVQIPPRKDARLVAESRDAVDWHKRLIATHFQLSLFVEGRVEFNLCMFKFWPPNPTSFKQPIQQLPKEVENRKIVTSKDDLRTKTAQSLPKWRTRGDCREDGAHEILKEATTVSTELFSDEVAVFWTDDKTRVTSKKCSSAIAPKHESFESMYASHFSITGKSLLRFTF